MFASLLVPLAVSIAALAAGNPTLPTRYHVKGNIILPSGQIVEPYEAWVDLEKGNSRIDYYGGKEVVDNNIVLFGCLLRTYICTYICSPWVMITRVPVAAGPVRKHCMSIYVTRVQCQNCCNTSSAVC